MEIAPTSTDHDNETSFIDEVIDPEAVDQMLANVTNQMTFEDRNAMQEEIHGVYNMCPEETPNLVQSSLLALSQELVTISIPEKAAFMKAQSLPRTYVNEEWFRLRFLRSDLFNVIAAAERMVRYLDLVDTYFGEIGLQRPIQLSDLVDDEKKCLASGQQQLLPYRDRSGRRIFVALGNLGTNFPQQVRFKVVLYLMWVIGEDVETQRRGMVVIIWPSQNTIIPDRNWVGLGQKTVKGFPVRGAALHVCLANTLAFRILKAQLGLAMPQDVRRRFQFHLGERTEIEYSLQSYGIFVDQIPLTGSGNVKLQNCHQWIKVRRAIECQNASRNSVTGIYTGSIVECPGVTDVIFRSGNKVHLFHPGNLLFRNIVEEISEEHSNAQSQAEKVDITWRVINEIKVQRNGRFLVWDKQAGWYTTLTDEGRIREKVALYIREFKRRVRAMSNRQEEESNTTSFEHQDGRKRRRTNGDEICCA